MPPTWLNRGGLLVPFSPPELTIWAAIARGWERPAGARLLLPRPPAFLPARTVWARPFARLELPDLGKRE